MDRINSKLPETESFIIKRIHVQLLLRSISTISIIAIANKKSGGMRGQRLSS